MEATNMTQKSNKMNPVATGVAGMVIGAGITAVAATALRDKQTRQKVKNALKTAGMKAMKYCDQLKGEIKNKASNGTGKTEKMNGMKNGIKSEIKEDTKKEPKKAI